jgi:outer membrane lipoprotein SlyB
MHITRIIAVLALAGCANTQYYNPDVSDAEAKRDLAQCQYEAKLATSNYSTGSTRASMSGAAGQGFAEGIGQSLEQRDLVRSCLTARGYRPQP